jgi:hypothetical protein
LVRSLPATFAIFFLLFPIIKRDPRRFFSTCTMGRACTIRFTDTGDSLAPRELLAAGLLWVSGENATRRRRLDDCSASNFKLSSSS